MLLGRALATMEQVLSLEAGDVLLLQKQADGAADLFVGDKVVALGFPVTCEGHYALQVASAPALVGE